MARSSPPAPTAAAPSSERGWSLLVLALACFAPLALGWRDPDPWWGVHQLAFLPPPWALATLLLAVVPVLFYPGIAALSQRVAAMLPRALARPIVLALLVGIAYATIFHLLDMGTDIFGDARRNLAAVESAIDRGNPDWLRAIFHPNLLFREGGDHFVTALVGLLAAGLGLSPSAAFGLFNAGFGLFFAAVWALFVLSHLRRHSERVLLLLVGLAAGMAPLFTEHSEVYAPAVVFKLLFLVVAVHALQARRRALLLLLLPVFLVAAKAHFANLVLALPLLLVALELSTGQRATLLTRKRALLFAAAPLLAAFLLLYFFVMKNHAISRFVDDAGRAQTFFLPLFDVETNGAPAYTLFSRHHLFDFLNIVLLWSLPALFLALFAWCFRRGRLRDAPAALVLVELVLLADVGVFFATNPVLGMPRDWDLFTFPAISLLAWVLLLIRQVARERGLPPRVLGTGFGLILLTLPIFAINHRPALLAPRIESIGVSTYQRYWKGAGYLLNVAAELGDPGPEMVLERRLHAYRKVKPVALAADAQLADLALRISRLLRQRGEVKRAIPFARDAMVASLGNEMCVHEMVLVQFGVGEFGPALLGAKALLAAEPRNTVYLELAVKSAYNARRWPEALEFGERYLSQRPEDSTMIELMQRARSRAGQTQP